MANPQKVLVYRHAAVTRITHWINVLALTLLLMSGLNIFGAHPALYWGQKSTFARPWVSIGAEMKGADMVGVTQIGSARFNTTGVLGYSGKPGSREPVAFPSWATVPSERDLADSRHWHFFFAWLFVLNGLVYWLVGLSRGHIVKDLAPTKADLKPKNVWHEIVTHAQLKFPKGEDARHYNVLQKGAYLAVIAILLPLMVLTGLCMSPGFDAGAPWLVDFFGGRQSARTIHFLTAFSIVGFILLHLFMVVASGTWNNIRSMITGRYAIVRDKTGGAA
ncbi:cytochrome b/b6 domain-containing protein [Phenylobacterium sp.]|jgi:thiosulfate reductase cytochrome b subunit|uniref:cytochrome b/b6 domain-containing protein n=1 Tax=Phenylobacterium sp. TaxID=1871053 RepID=UPI002E3816EA|nr:cytochrome b/b6 domain-containing protein [Phenylobacterium sp.]HEX3366125.1 cytochrome b/b6 domain-containing protein [Phenylobacterium sp.]